MAYLLMRAFLMVIFSLHALASEEAFETLEEMRLASFQAERYQETPVIIYPYTDQKISIFIQSSPGKAIPQTSEVISYDESSPQFMPHFCEDRVYEFLQKGKERLEMKQAENDEFDYGRMDEVKDAFKAPYKFFGNLLMTFPYSQESRNRPGRCIGSGLLMGPNQVLTAGHNVFDPKRGGWAKEIIFTPAQQKENKPFGEARATVLKTFKGWIEGKGEIYDMGVLILDRPLGYQAGWAGLAIIDDTYYLTEKPSIAIAGYPSTDARLLTQEGEAKISYAVMREHHGTIERPEASRLYYKVNTRVGQSGSPIVAYLKELGGYFVLGIHTHAHDEANEGTRLTATKFWAIHKCRQQFYMPDSLAPADQKPVTLRKDSQEGEVTLKAHRHIFHHALGSLKSSLSDSSSLTLFICYSQDEGKEHQDKVRVLAEDLRSSGIPYDNIYYDELANRPGSKYTIHQYQDSIFKVSKILVIGSQSLKRQYEKEEGGRGSTTQEIENLLTRITKTDKGVKGIIPIWFEGSQEENFPSALWNLRGEFMGQDYLLKFFELLQDLYPSSTTRHTISAKQQEFERLRASLNLNPSLMALYADKEAKEEKERQQEDQANILKALGLSIPQG